MLGISLSELIIIMFVLSIFLKPEEIQAVFTKCKQYYLIITQELRFFDSFSDTDIMCDQNIEIDVEKRKQKK